VQVPYNIRYSLQQTDRRDETTTRSPTPSAAALALVSLGGVGDKSDDRPGDERATEAAAAVAGQASTLSIGQ